METTGERRIPAPRQHVWNALVDPQVLRECLPGCQALDRTPDGGMTGVGRAFLGGVEARLAFRVEFAEADAPDGCSVIVTLEDGRIGAATLRIGVALDDEGGFTLLRYAADGSASGSLAGQGAGAHAVLMRFLDNFTAEAAAPESMAADGPAGAVAAVANTSAHSSNPPALVLALAAVPAEIYGLPTVFWGGSFVFLLIFLLVFSAYL